MQIRPIGDRVVVKRLPAEEKIGSIFVPSMAQEKPSRGVVVAVGPGKERPDGSRVEIEVRKDDVVIFGKYAGAEVKVDGDTYVCMHADDLIAVET